MTKPIPAGCDCPRAAKDRVNEELESVGVPARRRKVAGSAADLHVHMNYGGTYQE